MDLESAVGQGTLVTLRFPASEARAPGVPATPATPAQAPRQALSVLLVDDDDLVQASTRVVLEALGHRVTIVPSGEACLALLRDGQQVDRVILDLNMPGLGGAATLPLLRTLRPALPVLLATGRADQVALDLVAAHPGVSLMAKPFGLEELRKQLG